MFKDLTTGLFKFDDVEMDMEIVLTTTTDFVDTYEPLDFVYYDIEEDDSFANALASDF